MITLTSIPSGYAKAPRPATTPAGRQHAPNHPTASNQTVTSSPHTEGLRAVRRYQQQYATANQAIFERLIDDDFTYTATAAPAINKPSTVNIAIPAAPVFGNWVMF